MLYLIRKGKPETHGLPYILYNLSRMRLAVTIRGSGGLLFTLKDLIPSNDNLLCFYINKVFYS